MKYMDALKKYNEGKDKWCMPRKGSEDYLKILSMMKKISKIKKSKTSANNDINNEENTKKNKHIKVLQAAIKRRLIAKNVNSNSISKVSSKVSKPPSYNSGARVFSRDIYEHHDKATKIQHFLKNKLLINNNTLTNRINNYSLLKGKLSQLRADDCLEKKNFKDVKGYTIRNIINLEKKIGTKSKYGSIYLTSIPNILGMYPIASKIMKNNSDNISEVKIMTMITHNIILKKISRHFLIIYGSSTCTKNIAEKLRLISINEHADGDLKMLIHMRDIVENNELMFNILFQTFISIATFHNMVGYIHKDAHYGNFLYQTNNEKGYYHYIFYGKDYYLKSCKCNIIIFDYGFARKIVPYKNGDDVSLINKQNMLIMEDYQRIIYAFFNKKSGGWGSFKNLPNEPTNTNMIIIHNKLRELIVGEITYNSGGINYASRVFDDIIKYIFLKYSPKGMFVTQRPPNVINSIPFRIN